MSAADFTPGAINELRFAIRAEHFRDWKGLFAAALDAIEELQAALAPPKPEPITLEKLRKMFDDINEQARKPHPPAVYPPWKVLSEMDEPPPITNDLFSRIMKERDEWPKAILSFNPRQVEKSAYRRWLEEEYNRDPRRGLPDHD